MSYNFNYLLVFLSLISFSLSFGQEISDSKSDFNRERLGGFFSVGAYYPMGLGDQFAGDALSVRGGVSMAFLGRFPDKNFLLGGRYSIFKANIKEDALPLVGDFNHTTSHSISAEVGYIFWEQNEWVAYVTGSYGWVGYYNKNTEDHFKFRDSGTSLAFSPNISYRFHDNFAVYASVSYRHDFLRIKAPADFKKYLNQQDYIAFQLGVMLTF